MNAQPADIDVEDVTQRLAQKIGVLTAQLTIAESQRDAALQNVGSLTEQVIAGQEQINAMHSQVNDAYAAKLTAETECNALLREKGQPDVYVPRATIGDVHTMDCAYDLDHKGSCSDVEVERGSTGNDPEAPGNSGR